MGTVYPPPPPPHPPTSTMVTPLGFLRPAAAYKSKKKAKVTK